VNTRGRFNYDKLPHLSAEAAVRFAFKILIVNNESSLTVAELLETFKIQIPMKRDEMTR